jgi:glycopeptide antibiotics resistance protein
LKYQLKKFRKYAIRLFYYIYIIVLCYFLFFSEFFGRVSSSEEYRYNLEFLSEIKRFIIHRRQVGFYAFFINIAGNVIAFMPFGFLLPLLNAKYRGLFRVTIYSLLFSLAVEVIQMLSRVGAFDVDDILLNTLGGFLGYLLYAVHSLLHRVVQSSKGKGKKHD